MLLAAPTDSSAPPPVPVPVPASERRAGRPVARAAAGLLAAITVLGAPGTAAAHTGLTASTPAAGAGLEAPPAEVTLVFTEAVAADLADVVVTAPDGTDATSGEAQVSGETVTQPLSGTGAAGAYRVAYRVVAGDGHPVTGTLEFTVSAAAAGGSAGAEAPGADGGAPATGTGDASGGSPEAPAATPVADTGGAGWLVPVGAVALAVAGLGLLAARARAGRRSR